MEQTATGKLLYIGADIWVLTGFNACKIVSVQNCQQDGGHQVDERTHLVSDGSYLRGFFEVPCSIGYVMEQKFTF